MNNLHAVPEHLPKLPEGEVHLGQGPIGLPSSLTPFRGHATHVHVCKSWSSSMRYKGCTTDHYTAPLNSPVTRHVLSRRVPDGVEALPEGWMYVGMGEDMPLGDECQFWEDGMHSWEHGSGCCQNEWQHYACKIDSPLARKLLGLEPDDKPDWTDAPEWAQWLGQCASGAWEWYQDKPEPLARHWRHKSRGCMAFFGKPNPNWRNTLEPRPTQLPEGAPELPEGWEYAGTGEAMEHGEECLWWRSEYRQWKRSICGQMSNCHYARRKPEAEQEGDHGQFVGDRTGIAGVAAPDELRVRSIEFNADLDFAEPAPDVEVDSEVLDSDKLWEIFYILLDKGYRIEWDADGLRGWKDE